MASMQRMASALLSSHGCTDLGRSRLRCATSASAAELSAAMTGVSVAAGQASGDEVLGGSTTVWPSLCAIL
jgi:hypothetical protein